MAPINEVKKNVSTVAFKKQSSGKIAKKESTGKLLKRESSGKLHKRGSSGKLHKRESSGRLSPLDARRPGGLRAGLKRNEAALLFASQALNKKSSRAGLKQKRRSQGSHSDNRGQLAVPAGGGSGRSSPRQNLLTVGAAGVGSRVSVASATSGNSSGGNSSAGSQDSDDFRRSRKRKGKSSKHKKDNIFTKIRDGIAESDVLVERTSVYPHRSCIRISIILMPVFFCLLLWDTFALTLFQIPRLSLIDHPVFIMVFQSACILIAIYGYCIQVIENEKDKILSKAIISIACHIILFMWRVALELIMDGFRYQEKSYLPRSEYL